MYLEILAVALAALLLHYWWNVWQFRKRSIPHYWPVPIMGSDVSVFKSRRSTFPYLIRDYYDRFRGSQVCGYFEFTRRMIMIRDPEMIKNVTVKDFDHFTDHRTTLPEDLEPLFARNVFGLKGHEWKTTRNMLSPAFTSSKMKFMFQLVSECGKQLVNHIQKLQQEEGGVLKIDVKDLYTRYTNDVIATCAFGITCNSLEETDNKFYQMGRKVTNLSGKTLVRFVAGMMVPKLMKLFGIPVFAKDATDFFKQLISHTLRTREENNIVRPDMLHLMLEARKVQKELADDDIAAQAFIFFFAGFETTSTLLCFTTLVLAMHPEVQKKLQHHIDEVISEENQTISYETLLGMTYLDMVVSETLRVYPPVSATDRRCVKAYTIPATENRPGLQIEEGEIISIPVVGLHMDPDYFPDPDSFQPERFSEENKHNIKPYTYLPFGAGPRICLGNRFALMEVKTALVYLLSRFDLQVVDKTPLPFKLTNAMQVEGGFWIGLTPRNKQASSLPSISKTLILILCSATG